MLNDNQAEIIKRLNDRHKEQELSYQIAQQLAAVGTVEDMNGFAHKTLNSYFNCAALLAFISDVEERNYTLLFSSEATLAGRANRELAYPCSDLFFQKTVSSAEPIRYTKDQINTDLIPSSHILRKSFTKNLTYLLPVAIHLPADKRYLLLCLLFNDRKDRTQEVLSRIKLLEPQLRVTCSNMIFSQQPQIQASPVNSESAVKAFPADNLLIGISSAMDQLREQISMVAPTSITVLLQGESGTGKEVVAQQIHNESKRAAKEMIKVNCAAIPPNLIESELFGHEKGSFTGALKRRKGKFELADHGTIFLDEIGELPLLLQAKLLRVLQEREIERIGGTKTIKIDVRIIAATNRDLLTEVQKGNFREDLYYRLFTFPIQLPPLRERLEDIPALSKHFLEKFASGFVAKSISVQALKKMQLHSWPGNVRELEHSIARAVLLSADSKTINEIPMISTLGRQQDSTPHFTMKTLAEFEREYILWVLRQCGGRISGVAGAAKVLGMPATTLQSKLKKLGIGKKFGT